MPPGSFIQYQNGGRVMKRFVKVMKALGDPRRVTIIKLLQHRPMCVCEIQAILGVSQSTTSKHLKILEEAGLVTYKKDGLWVNYELSDGKSSPYAAALLGNLRRWLDEDPTIRQAVEKLPTVDRFVICRKGP